MDQNPPTPTPTATREKLHITLELAPHWRNRLEQVRLCLLAGGISIEADDQAELALRLMIRGWLDLQKQLERSSVRELPMEANRGTR